MNGVLYSTVRSTVASGTVHTTTAMVSSSCSQPPTSGSCCCFVNKVSSCSLLPAASSLFSYRRQSGGIGASKVVGLQPARRVSRRRFQTWRAVSEIVGEPNMSARLGKVKETKVVLMVDPVEAKRLAALERQAIHTRSKLKRQREIEAFNGGWAVVGLTAGILNEGYTGNSILIQIAGYLDFLADSLTSINPS